MLRTLVIYLNSLNTWLGKLASLSLIALVTLTFFVVVSRYAFNLGSVAIQELIIYLHAFSFLGGMALTLQYDKHVRVDIFYRHFSLRTQAWINAVGAIIFLLPLCAFFFINSFDYVAQSWAMREGSASGNGLPYVYLLKTCILGFSLSLAIQATCELGKALLILNKDSQSISEPQS